MSTDLTDQDWRCPRCETEWSAAYTECKYCPDETGAAMPIELTDADLEVLDYALAECDGGFADEAIRTVFLRAKEHGLAAGRARAIEEAAHICEVQGRLWAMHPAKSNNDVRKKEARRDEAYSLATALRALNAASPAS